jgi:hypothetical protein
MVVYSIRTCVRTTSRGSHDKQCRPLLVVCGGVHHTQVGRAHLRAQLVLPVVAFRLDVGRTDEEQLWGVVRRSAQGHLRPCRALGHCNELPAPNRWHRAQSMTAVCHSPRCHERLRDEEEGGCLGQAVTAHTAGHAYASSTTPGKAGRGAQELTVQYSHAEDGWQAPWPGQATHLNSEPGWKASGPSTSEPPGSTPGFPAAAWSCGGGGRGQRARQQGMQQDESIGHAQLRKQTPAREAQPHQPAKRKHGYT